MDSGQFRVDEVFDIGSRGGILVVGKFVAEQPNGMPAMCDATTGHRLNILGVEFATPRTLATGQTTFVVDRADREYASVGRTWTIDNAS